MAHARSSRFPQRNVGSRRKTAWSIGPFQSGLSISAAGSALITTGSQVTDDGITQVRLHGEVNAYLNSLDAADSGFPRNAIGFCYVSENAFNVGVTAVPAPLTDIGWDGWLFHRQFSLRGETTADSKGNAGSAQVRFLIDSKAMRKTRQSDVLICVFEAGTEVGTSTLNIDVTSRILDKLA